MKLRIVAMMLAKRMQRYYRMSQDFAMIGTSRHQQQATGPLDSSYVRSIINGYQPAAHSAEAAKAGGKERCWSGEGGVQALHACLQDYVSMSKDCTVLQSAWKGHALEDENCTCCARCPT